jgi:IclR family pca regulon transcriptional regulator
MVVVEVMITSFLGGNAMVVAPTGRVLLSGQEQSHVLFLLNRMTRPAYTPHTITGVSEIVEQIRLVKIQGYAIATEELEIGIRSMAIPIRNARGEMVAAMSISVATRRMTVEAIVANLLPELESARMLFSSLL